MPVGFDNRNFQFFNLKSLIFFSFLFCSLPNFFPVLAVKIKDKCAPLKIHLSTQFERRKKNANFLRPSHFIFFYILFRGCPNSVVKHSPSGETFKNSIENLFEIKIQKQKKMKKNSKSVNYFIVGMDGYIISNCYPIMSA